MFGPKGGQVTGMYEGLPSLVIFDGHDWECWGMSVSVSVVLRSAAGRVTDLFPSPEH